MEKTNTTNNQCKKKTTTTTTIKKSHHASLLYLDAWTALEECLHQVDAVSLCHQLLAAKVTLRQVDHRERTRTIQKGFKR
jgi:hypothetical protein